jgi:hypothetical protein
VGPRDLFPRLPHVDRAAMAGRWHIQRTTFPMWLSGSKLSPSLEYGVVEGDPRLTDTVTYRTRAGAEKTIRGFDTQDQEISARFVWRGKGLLAPLKSEWWVYHFDPSAGVCAIYFGRTLFTPEGIDVVSRAEVATDSDLQGALTATRDVPALAGLLSTLRPVVRAGGALRRGGA